MKFSYALLGIVTLVNLPARISSQNTIATVVNEAEVYTNGYAQIYAHTEQKLKRGVNTIVLFITGRNIQLQTLTCEIKPSGRIVRMSEPLEPDCSEDDSCRYYTEMTNTLKKKINEKSLELEKLDAQEKILMENARITNSANLNLTMLRESIQFLQRQFNEVKEARSRAKSQMEDLQKDYQNHQTQLNNRMQYLRQSIRKVSILAEVPSEGIYKFQLSYVSSGIKWTKNQEVDITEAEQKAVLSNVASVQTEFREIWRNVKLTLIDKIFDFSVSPLEVKPMRVMFQPQSALTNEASTYRIQAARVSSSSAAKEILTAEDIAILQSDRVQSADGEVYILTGSYTLSAEKTIQAELFTDTLPVHLQYVLAPYMTKKVQLLGIIRQRTETISLTPSVVRLNGRPVGLGSTPTIYGSDSAAFHLGFLQDVHVQRKRENPFSSRSFFGNSQRDTYEYTIDITNRRSAPIAIMVIDRVPVSTDSQIDVKFKKSDNTQPDKNGILRWMVNLQAGARQRLSFTFEVTYPKGRTIAFGDEYKE